MESSLVVALQHAGYTAITPDTIHQLYQHKAPERLHALQYLCRTCDAELYDFTTQQQHNTSLSPTDQEWHNIVYLLTDLNVVDSDRVQMVYGGCDTQADNKFVFNMLLDIIDPSTAVAATSTIASTTTNSTLTIDTSVRLIHHVAQNRAALLHSNVTMFPSYIKIAKYSKTTPVDMSAVTAQSADLQTQISTIDQTNSAAMANDNTDAALAKLNDELINLHSTLNQFNTVYTEKLHTYVQSHLNVTPPTAGESAIDTCVPQCVTSRTGLMQMIDNVRTMKQAIADVSSDNTKHAVSQLKPTTQHTDKMKQYTDHHDAVQQSVSRLRQGPILKYTAKPAPAPEHRRQPSNSRRYKIIPDTVTQQSIVPPG